MGHSSSVHLLAVVAVLVSAAGAAGCDADRSPAPPTATIPSRAPSSAPALPAWAEHQALWTAMYNGDAHPDAIRWTSTTLGRASRLIRSESAYRDFYSRQPMSRLMAYAVVVSGDFAMQEQGSPPPHATRLFLILRGGPSGSSVLVTDSSRRDYDLGRTGAVHLSAVQAPVDDGVWGRTGWAGGPFPGTGGSIGHVTVSVFAGRIDLTTASSVRPLTTVESDAEGFFTLVLDPGTYTFLFRRSNWGPSSPWTVDLEPGRPVAVPVFANVP